MIPANFPAVQIGWSGYRDPEPDEHTEALGEFPRMPEMPEEDALPSRIHALGYSEIDVFGPSLWQRVKDWWRNGEVVIAFRRRR